MSTGAHNAPAGAWHDPRAPPRRAHACTVVGKQNAGCGPPPREPNAAPHQGAGDHNESRGARGVPPVSAKGDGEGPGQARQVSSTTDAGGPRQRPRQPSSPSGSRAAARTVRVCVVIIFYSISISGGGPRTLYPPITRQRAVPACVKVTEEGAGAFQRSGPPRGVVHPCAGRA